MLQRIKNLVRALVCKTQAKASKKVTQTPPQPLRKFATMRPTNQVANVGGTDHPVYHAHGSKQAHVLMGTTFVPLSVFKTRR